MLVELLPLAPVPPLLAAACIGYGMASGRARGEQAEMWLRRLVLGASLLALLPLLAAAWMKLDDNFAAQFKLGTWIESGTYRVDVEFLLDGLSLPLAALFVALAAGVLGFASIPLQRADGFPRFLLVLSLFETALLSLITAGNAAFCFATWELAGLSSYLLLACRYAPAASIAPFVSSRIGEVGFVLGVALSFLWTAGIDWAHVSGQAAALQEWQAGVLACCFLLAAAAQSGLVPLSPWLLRAVQGPTPANAVFYGVLMIHLGVYLVLRLQPLFEQAPLVMGLMAVLGLVTALSSFCCGLVHTDVKSALAFSATSQVGLMFFAAGLGLWRWAFWHMCGHAVFRAYQFLSAPTPLRWPPSTCLERFVWVQAAALRLFWLDALGEHLVARPVRALALDLQNFERHVLEPLWRWPGWLLRGLANLGQWFDDRLIAQGVGKSPRTRGRRIGRRLQQVEVLLSQPRYWVLFVLATLLVVL
jgi:NADH:ubiquinone oxidoreductase subunit 5 (subunit L)/multisubunit Na+/H+ antiporter MnhA subunit